MSMNITKKSNRAVSLYPISCVFCVVFHTWGRRLGRVPNLCTRKTSKTFFTATWYRLPKSYRHRQQYMNLFSGQWHRHFLLDFMFYWRLSVFTILMSDYWILYVIQGVWSRWLWPPARVVWNQGAVPVHHQVRHNAKFSDFVVQSTLDYPPLSLSAIKTIGTDFFHSIALDSPPRSIIRQYLSGSDGGG